MVLSSAPTATPRPLRKIVAQFGDLAFEFGQHDGHRHAIGRFGDARGGVAAGRLDRRDGSIATAPTAGSSPSAANRGRRRWSAARSSRSAPLQSSSCFGGEIADLQRQIGGHRAQAVARI